MRNVLIATSGGVGLLVKGLFGAADDPVVPFWFSTAVRFANCADWETMLPMRLAGRLLVDMVMTIGGF